jgi:hypothetical protein
MARYASFTEEHLKRINDQLTMVRMNLTHDMSPSRLDGMRQALNRIQDAVENALREDSLEEVPEASGGMLTPEKCAYAVRRAADETSNGHSQMYAREVRARAELYAEKILAEGLRFSSEESAKRAFMEYLYS